MFGLGQGNNHDLKHTAKITQVDLLTLKVQTHQRDLHNHRKLKLIGQEPKPNHDTAN